jgi:hypothetical protein
LLYIILTTVENATIICALPKEPTLFGKRIHLSCEVKYLGETLDKELTWKKQMAKVID